MTPDRWRPFTFYLLRSTGMAFAEMALDDGSELSDWSSACLAERRKLWAKIEDPAFREAIFLSNPELDRKVSEWAAGFLSSDRNSKMRQRERTLLRYVQRFCARNETTSYFGPVALGTWDQSAPVALDCSSHVLRRPFAAHWVVEKVLDAALPDPWALPRRAPSVEVSDQGASRVGVAGEGGRFEEVGAVGHRALKVALHLCDGSRTASEVIDCLADAAGLDEKEAEALLGELASAGLLVDACALPTGLTDPVVVALARLAAAGADPIWSDQLTWLGDRISNLGTENLETRRETFASIAAKVAEWVGEAPYRKRGHFYASRTAVIEMADRPETVSLPSKWRDDASAALGAYAELHLAQKLVERARFRTWYGGHFGSQSTRWTEVFNRRQADWVGLRLAEPEGAGHIDGWWQEHRARIEERLIGHMEGPGMETSLALDAPDPIDLRLNAERAYINPDLMFAVGDDGACTPILGESHFLPVLSGNLVVALDKPERLLSESRSLLNELASPGRPALVWGAESSFVDVRPDYGEVAIELGGTAPYPPDRRVSFAELESRLEGDDFELAATTYSGHRTALTPLTRTARLDLAASAFSVPVPTIGEWLAGDFGRRDLPRITWRGLVVQRRTWRVASEDWTSTRTAAAALNKLRNRCGASLPRFVFITAPSEPKPIAFDLASALNVEMAIWLSQREPLLSFSEMLPGPDELWLRTERGRHTSEVRTLLVRSGESRAHR